MFATYKSMGRKAQFCCHALLPYGVKHRFTQFNGIKRIIQDTSSSKLIDVIHVQT